jgi:hypothetical protein
LVFLFFSFSTLFTFTDIDVGYLLMKQSDKANKSYPALGDASFSAIPATARVEAFQVDEFYRNFHQLIDSIPSNERCAAFGLEPHNESTPRRIFFGIMLADENMDVLRVNAIEAHGVYKSWH